MEDQLQNIIDRLERVETKLNKITELLDNNVLNNCEKMGEHIDFVERVYENVKNPLGYICNKVRFLSSSQQYSLETTDDETSYEPLSPNTN